MTFDEKVTHVKQIMFQNDEDRFNRLLWRMSNGSKIIALRTTQRICRKFDIEVTEDVFDEVILQMNKNIVVEWVVF